MKTSKFFLIAFLVFSTSLTNAQSYSLENESSTLSVIGTSTLHDWKIKADTIGGGAVLVMDEEGLKGITSLNIIVLISSMHSGLDPMDVHMRKALTANQSNSIEFQLTKTNKLTLNTIGGYTVQAEGKISIIKNVKVVNIQATMEPIENGAIRFFGETMIDMTDYSVELPQAEMGSIIAEKDVKIVFDVVFKK